MKRSSPNTIDSISSGKLLEVLMAFKEGNFKVRMPQYKNGIEGKITETLNDIIISAEKMEKEFGLISNAVGKEGKIQERISTVNFEGSWATSMQSVNLLIEDIAQPITEIGRVIAVVANGDLTKKITVDVKGDLLELKNTINTMVDQLNGFASEVTRVAREVGTEGKLGGQARTPGVAGIWKDLTTNVNLLASNLTSQVRAISEVATAVTKGDLSRFITIEVEGEVATLKNNLNEMIQRLKETTRINTEQDWLKTNLAKFAILLQGQRDLENVGRLVLSELAPLINVHYGIFYTNEIIETESVLRPLASYAFQERPFQPNHFRQGEGLVGQCSVEKKKIIIRDVPESYIKISSGLGEAFPLDIIVIPILFDGKTNAVLELASFHQFTAIHLIFLDQLVESIGIILNTIAVSMRTEELLDQSQALTEELRGRQNELENSNVQLEEQAQSLLSSGELLKSQREELQQKNQELQEKATLLEQQNKEVETKNAEVEYARNSLEEKAKQLALTSKYKSEFLANMSHELRTPLNSILILSKLLSNNEGNNLILKQIEFANTIHSSGQDLLQLINDILDLSKIESGKMTVEIITQKFKDISTYIERAFGEIAKHKGIEFFIELDENLPEAIETDTQRLLQVIRNLLSNAFKFTEKGKVTFKIFLAKEDWSPSHPVLNKAKQVIGFSVNDTGIGIPLDKQGIIFEAFIQMDGNSNRNHGGTGLGLSISRVIARLLGGEIKIQSVPEVGSIFTLFLPAVYLSSSTLPLPEQTERDVENIYVPKINLIRNVFKVNPSRGILDDREQMNETDNAILIIEDDEVFARFLYDLSHECGYKALIALTGEEGMQLIERFQIQGIFLDIVLPELEGWAILDFLKRNYRYRHIPVNILSVNNQWRRSILMGALAHITKPVAKEDLVKAFAKMKSFNERRKRKLLIVDDGDDSRNSILKLMQGDDVETKTVGTSDDAIDFLIKEKFDCIILDLGLSNKSGFELLEAMKDNAIDEVPIIVYIGKEISKDDDIYLKKLAKRIIIKPVDSIGRLLEETSIFLHRLQDDIPEENRKLIQRVQLPDSVLQGKTILIVDDDIRNIFAMISVLERHKMKVLNAENAKDGIELLQKLEHIDIILMDIMMPEMDGYEAMREIRKIDRFRDIPIIAVTAKAMKGDKRKSLEAGASDYITKPVNIDQLISILRIWFYKH
ncbi:MAG TPA: response regulator [Leptospiraceae bacterium]|nr:response regulator [Leptospiraceae bacterium]HRG74223.1 response regulator [Leptospiraceae bacterium]